jgi:hypothetical protein
MVFLCLWKRCKRFMPHGRPQHSPSKHIWTKHCGAKVKAEIVLAGFVQNGAAVGGNARPFAGVEGTVCIAEVVIRTSVKDWAVSWPFFAAKLRSQMAPMTASLEGGGKGHDLPWEPPGPAK